jgi:hypothetical protein
MNFFSIYSRFKLTSDNWGGLKYIDPRARFGGWMNGWMHGLRHCFLNKKSMYKAGTKNKQTHIVYWWMLDTVKACNRCSKIFLRFLAIITRKKIDKSPSCLLSAHQFGPSSLCEHITALNRDKLKSTGLAVIWSMHSIFIANDQYNLEPR